MTRNDEIRPDLDQGIDRKVLSQLRKRFLDINQGRMERALEGFSNRQQAVLKLLPLFFHVNHPLLPGYVSGSTPAGISTYEPEDDVLAEAQRLTRSFSYKTRQGNLPRPILGLFLMGSLGTLAQTENSDMDMWVCHDASLSDQGKEELARKCTLLEVWAESQGAEAHFFLIDSERFAQGERDDALSSENCGSTQHYLLLDEFYRTAIWMAGRTPLWWLVPVYEESRYAEYTHTLLSKRFIRENEVLDLGHMAHIPPGEFIGAGLWQLYKGIDSPYKSVLKLLLTEVYASEHPHVQCLSLRFKQAVFSRQLDLDEFDPYVMVYRRIEEYLLARNEPQRLELVRRAFYLKVNKKLSGPARLRSQGWQRQVLEKLTTEWQWDERQLMLLDSRTQWKVRQVGSERRALINELNYSYRFLTQFARNQPMGTPTDRRDMNILGRRLYAAFERRAGKIEHINPGIAPDLAEDTLTLVQSPNKREPGQTQWAIFTGNLGTQEWEHFSPLKRSRELIELLAWSHRNGVIDSSTRMALHPGTSDLTEFELFNLLGSLQQSIDLQQNDVSDEQLLLPSVPAEVLLMVNVGVDPLGHHRDLNILMTTERTDSLSYAGVRENLVLTLDQVMINSWNEVQVSRYDSPHALLDCLRDYLNSLVSERPAPRLRVRCFCHNRAAAIAQRVEALFNTAQQLLEQNRDYRYLFKVEKHYHLLKLVRGNVSHRVLESLPALIGQLGEAQSGYSPLRVDEHALEGQDLALVLAQGKPNCVQVFYRQYDRQAQLYVLDEFNVLWCQRLPYLDENTLLAPLQRFLHSILFRREALRPMEDGFPAPPLELRYYRMMPAGTATSTVPARAVESRLAPHGAVERPFYDIQAIIERTSTDQHQITLYCNQREFSELEHGAQLYTKVAQQIIAQRTGGERYRCYITDLDLSGVFTDSAPSTHAYLRYKTELERSLNSALTNL
jgi:adenylate cyclase class 1